jgi:hypothetical protein
VNGAQTARLQQSALQYKTQRGRNIRNRGIYGKTEEYMEKPTSPSGVRKRQINKHFRFHDEMFVMMMMTMMMMMMVSSTSQKT